MGAYFPDKPSKEHQEKTRVFVEALALMYPCVHCAEDFQNEVKKSPPRYVGDQEGTGDGAPGERR